MGVNSLPKTATRQRRDCDLNPGLTAPESSTLTTRLPSHPVLVTLVYRTAQLHAGYVLSGASYKSTHVGRPGGSVTDGFHKMSGSGRVEVRL